MSSEYTSTKRKRVVIVGAGFAGLTLARKLSPLYFEVVLIDKNNYHQFQPLLYQVATAGLEPSSISFPLRKIFQNKSNIYIRIAEVKRIHPDRSVIETSIGTMMYDYLVLASGAETNFFGNRPLQQNSYSMKSVSDALLIRNSLLQNYEQALVSSDENERESLLNIVIVGGGPTGVELAGAVAEMRNQLLPKDYPELNFNRMKIYLLEAAPNLLGSMSRRSAETVRNYLVKMGVDLKTNLAVTNYDGRTVELSDGGSIQSRCLIWTAGVKGLPIPGLPQHCLLPNQRVLVDGYNRVPGMNNIFVIGDLASMSSEANPKGHPQVAPVAMQQASLLAENLKRIADGKTKKRFQYKDKGSMATVGKNKAVAELKSLRFSGYPAWAMWMFIHLMSVIGVKNRVLILINWVWQYLTYDQSLRLIIKPSEKKKQPGIPEIRRPIRQTA